MHYVCEHLMVYKVAVLIWHTFQEGKCSPAYLIIINPHLSFQGFPGGSVVKKSTCQCRRLVFNLWVGKIPQSRNGNPLQESCLGNTMDRRDWLWFPLGLTDSPFSPRDSQESSLTPQCESINSLALNLLYGPNLIPVHDYWKDRSFDNVDLCQQSDVFAF